MYYMEYVFVFFIGASIASTINVIVYRGVRNMNFITGHSACPFCQHRLSYGDMFPVFGYLINRGRCRYCHHVLSIRYLLTEIVGGLIGILSYLQYSYIQVILYFALLNILLMISLFDIEIQEIDTKFQIVVFILLYFIRRMEGYNFAYGWIYGLIIFLTLFLIAKISHGLGGADILLYTIFSFYYQQQTIYIILYGLTIASIYSITLIIKDRKNIKRKIPFLPFISSGYFIYVIFKIFNKF